MMGIKRQANHRSYGNTKFPFLYYQTIASTMSKGHFEDITRCLLIYDDNALDREESTMDAIKLLKLGWLITKM